MFEIFNLFIVRPWLALIPAVILLLLWKAGPSRVALVAAIIWLLYTVLEYSIWMRWTCSADCNIRVDLLLIAPLLWIATIAGIAHAVWRASKRLRSGFGQPLS